MSTLNFPTSPAVNQLYSFGGKTWIWTGAGWRLNPTGAINNIPIGNVTPSTGNFTQLTSVGNISAVGNITGAFLYGNGRFLTGISGGSGGNGTNIHNGTTTVDIPLPDSNVEITVGGVANIAVFSTTDITVGANIIPSSPTLTVGTLAAPFAEGYFSGNSVWVGNAKLTANATTVTITNPQGGEFSLSGTTDYTPYANADATALLANFGSNTISTTGNITAANFIGNVTANIVVPGANTEVLFNNNDSLGASSTFTFDSASNVLSVAGNIVGTNIQGDGAALTSTLTDKGSDQNDWDTLIQMGVYAVNRSSWSGTTGTPLDSQVFVGLLEVKNSSNLGIVQIYGPGTVDDPNNVKIQWNRNYWNGAWTQWVRMTNDQQQIDGGGF
jgi:hypothetical protein